MKRTQLFRKMTQFLFGLMAALGLPIASMAGPEILLTTADGRLHKAMAVQHLYTQQLMAQPEILGTAVGLAPDGQPALIIYVNAEGANPDAAMAALPRTLGNRQLGRVPVIGQLTERFRAFGPKGSAGTRGGGVSHTAIQSPPIQLGTSGGWRYDLANGYCCSGTLGSLVQKGGTLYILSNYHVFWGDIVPGGNNRVATAGDPVIQPGLVDVGCNANNAQNVATLSGAGSLPGANVDAGIAQVVSGQVDQFGAILEIGTISPATVAAYVGQPVKKSGRTTGLSHSSVSGLNATVSVTYDNECAGGTAFTKTFTGQIIVNNRGSKFLNSGDSGSLMVEDVTTNPHAVGLLFAGSSTLAVANPIGEVLAFFGVSMVGQ